MFSILLISLTLFLLLYGRVNFIVLLAAMAIFSLFYHKSIKNHSHNHGFLEIDMYASKSALLEWNPYAKVLFGFAMLLTCVFSNTLAVPIFIFTAMTFITVVLGKLRLADFIKLLHIPLNFALLSLITILLAFSNTPYGVLNIPFGTTYLVVSSAAQIHALYLIVRVLGALSCLYMISLSTPMGDIIHVLSKLKIPEIIRDLMYLIYRYIFLLLSTFQNMNNAANARLGYRNYKTSIKTILYIAGNLFFISLKKASDSFNAMESRLYNGNIQFFRRANPIDFKQILVYSTVIFPVILYYLLGAI